MDFSYHDQILHQKLWICWVWTLNTPSQNYFIKMLLWIKCSAFLGQLLKQSKWTMPKVLLKMCRNILIFVGCREWSTCCAQYEMQRKNDCANAKWNTDTYRSMSSGIRRDELISAKSSDGRDLSILLPNKRRACKNIKDANVWVKSAFGLILYVWLERDIWCVWMK